MVKQYGIFERINPGEIYEVIRSGNQIKEECPGFFHAGHYFDCETYGIREMSEREIKLHVLPKQDLIHDNRKREEYEKWVLENDRCESLGINSFYIGETKFYTIDREEFKDIRNKSKLEGKRLFEYRGRMFSVYHFC